MLTSTSQSSLLEEVKLLKERNGKLEEENARLKKVEEENLRLKQELRRLKESLSFLARTSEDDSSSPLVNEQTSSGSVAAVTGQESTNTNQPQGYS